MTDLDLHRRIYDLVGERDAANHRIATLETAIDKAIVTLEGNTDPPVPPGFAYTILRNVMEATDD